MFRLYDEEGRNSTDNETAMDGGSYSRSDILLLQNSPSSNVHGCILLDEAAEVIPYCMKLLSFMQAFCYFSMQSACVNIFFSLLCQLPVTREITI